MITDEHPPARSAYAALATAGDSRTLRPRKLRREQDSLQVRLSEPERVTAFPDHDVGIETVGQLQEEPSPLSVHPCAHEGGGHRLLGCLLHLDRFSDDSPDGCSDIAR